MSYVMLSLSMHICMCLYVCSTCIGHSASRGWEVSRWRALLFQVFCLTLDQHQQPGASLAAQQPNYVSDSAKIQGSAHT